MQRTIGLERTYVLGSYKNLKVTDYISNIPVNILLNAQAMKDLARLQWTRLDSVYFDYISNSPTLKEAVTSEEAVEMIEKIQETSFEKLMEAYASIIPEDVDE